MSQANEIRQSDRDSRGRGAQKEQINDYITNIYFRLNISLDQYYASKK